MPQITDTAAKASQARRLMLCTVGDDRPIPTGGRTPADELVCQLRRENPLPSRYLTVILQITVR
jgi:hypothetical protein